jgi:hypothetical protein
MHAQTDTKMQASRFGHAGPELTNQARTTSAGGTAERFSLGAAGNGLSAAQAIGLQKTIGNRAVAQLMRGSMQASQPGGMSRGKQPDETPQQMVVQRRVISPDIYSSYDDNKARESTKSMFIASGQEDRLIEWEQAAKNYIGTIKSLRGNEMVKDQAVAALEGMTVKLGEITAAKNAGVLAMTAIIENYKANAKKPAVRKGRGGTATERLTALVEQTRKLDETVQKAIMDSVAQVQADYDKANLLQAEISTFVTELQKEANDMKKGKTSYEKMKESHGKATGEGGLFTMAAALGVEIPNSINTLATEATEKANGKLWIEAGNSASTGSEQLEKLRGRVSTAVANKNKYEELFAEFPLCKKVTEEFDRLNINDGGELKLMNDARLEGITAARGKNWAEAKNKAQKTMQIARKLDGLADKFRSYSDGAKPKLLQGTILTIFHKLGERPDYTNNDALEYMQNIYEQQCEVKRENWLTFLGIAGENIVGSDSDHYTTFNDSVPPVATFSVMEKTKEELCDELFGIANEMKRLHSTRVVGVPRYHRYWQTMEQADPIYSNNVIDNDIENTNPVAFGALNGRYNVMRLHMMTKVQEAIDQHGRVGTNDRGQQLVFP